MSVPRCCAPQQRTAAPQSQGDRSRMPCTSESGHPLLAGRYWPQHLLLSNPVSALCRRQLQCQHQPPSTCSPPGSVCLSKHSTAGVCLAVLGRSPEPPASPSHNPQPSDMSRSIVRRSLVHRQHLSARGASFLVIVFISLFF